MNIVILGAGLAGLSAAYHLKEDYEIFEKEGTIGGLCRSHVCRGFTFDTAGHLLHFKDRSNQVFVRRLLEGNIARVQRKSWVWSHGTFIRYPFQAHLYGLPAAVVDECVKGFKKAHRRPGKDFESWAYATFGNGIAKHFLVPYNEKFWRFPLDKLDAAWARGWIPVPTLKEVEEGAFRDSKKEFGYNAVFWYPRRGGIQALPQAFARHIKKIQTCHEAVRLDLDKKEVLFKNGTRAGFRKVITTVPLPALASMVTPLPQRVRRAFLKLKYVSVLNINLGIARVLDREKHWVYFPQKKIAFYRLGIASNFCPSLSPQGASSLYSEISYPPAKPVDKKHIVDIVLRGCLKAGFSFRKKDIRVCDINDITYGYCIYDAARLGALDIIQRHLGLHGVFSIGRYGGWKYASMEDVIAEGRDTARKIQEEVGSLS